MRRTRGCELPGTFTPAIVADLFLEQSRPWEAIAHHHVKKTWDAASRFVNHVVAYAADDSTVKALLHEVFEPAMKDILKEMRDKTSELLNPHRNGHPITYNDLFLNTLEDVRYKRRKLERETALRQFFGVDSLHAYKLAGTYDLQKLADFVGKEPGAGREAVRGQRSPRLPERLLRGEF